MVDSHYKINVMIVKINLTILIVLAILACGSGIMMNVDEKREEFWLKTGQTLLALMFIECAVWLLISIWTDQI